MQRPKIFQIHDLYRNIIKVLRSIPFQVHIWKFAFLDNLEPNALTEGGMIKLSISIKKLNGLRIYNE